MFIATNQVMSCWSISTKVDVPKIRLMQHPPKLVCPTMHGLGIVAPNLVVVSHLMEEHFPKYILMATVECVIGVTTILATPKKILIMGQAN
jgi:hypothetical protein